MASSISGIEKTLVDLQGTCIVRTGDPSRIPRSGVMERSYRCITQYRPPEWAKGLPAHAVPDSIVTLCQLPTPMHEWTRFPGLPEAFSLGIKRDDLTHSTLTGCKVRKLEFLLADAIQKKCSAVITTGAVNTNHGRATVVAAAELGLDPYLVVAASAAEIENKDRLPCRGNILLNRMVGAGIILAQCSGDEDTFFSDCVIPRMEKLAKDLLAEGTKAYTIPVGGSNTLALWAYVSAFQEMMEQGLLEKYDDVVAVFGTGGTCTGLAVANYLVGSPLKIHGISIAADTDLAYQQVDEELSNIELHSKVCGRDIIDIVDYTGEGYGIISDEVHDFTLSVARKTGIILQPMYTGKAAHGLHDMVNRQPERFKGRRILFLHSGSVLGVFDKSIEPRLQDTSLGQVVDWTHELSPLPRLLK